MQIWKILPPIQEVKSQPVTDQPLVVSGQIWSTLQKAAYRLLTTTVSLEAIDHWKWEFENLLTNTRRQRLVINRRFLRWDNDTSGIQLNVFLV